jgi:hypothetical protein
MDDLTEHLISKLKTLDETIWEQQVSHPQIEAWLDNFAPDRPGVTSERLHCLYLLGQFMYFGDRQIRELLKAIFRDLYKYPLIEEIRRANGDTLDLAFIKARFDEELQKTRFLGMGNPSESGTHLLYFFRQENDLGKKLFIHSHQIFTRRSEIPKSGLMRLLYAIASIFGHNRLALKDPNVKRYVFIDDICGTGSQAEDYSTEILVGLKARKPDAEASYFSLFATSEGLDYVRRNTLFDKVDSIFELDETFKCFDPESRYFQPADTRIDQAFAEQVCRTYGQALFPRHPLGYGNGQLMLALHHNTPDNTLPIFWCDEFGKQAWVPIFRRYPKHYGWF